MLREAHSELQLLYREKNRELEQLSATLASHSSTYQALQAQVREAVLYSSCIIFLLFLGRGRLKTKKFQLIVPSK